MVKKDRKQITAMVLALLASFIMWVYITNSENPQKSKTIYNVKVNLTNQDNIRQAGLALLPDQTFSVNVKVTGSASDVNSITASDFVTSADMNTELVAGSNKIYVNLQQMPRNVKVDVHEEALYIIVQLDELKEKQMPVSLDVKGIPSSGYENAGSIVKPDSVIISGPAKYVDSVVNVSGKIDITGAFSDVSGGAPLKALDKYGKEVSNITITPEYANATVSIKASKIVNVSVKTIGSAPDDVMITSIVANPETIKILGDEDIISGITKLETQAIDISKISKTQHVNTTIIVPSGVTVLNNATGIRVTFNVEDIIEHTFAVSLSLNGENESMNYALNYDEASVILRGRKDIIESIAAEDIKATIDVNNMSEGNYEANVKITAPSGAELVKVSPDKITVTVTLK